MRRIRHVRSLDLGQTHGHGHHRGHGCCHHEEEHHHESPEWGDLRVHVQTFLQRIWIEEEEFASLKKVYEGSKVLRAQKPGERIEDKEELRQRKSQ